MQQETKRKLWFIRKTYGYGWTPATWQGWVSILVYIVLVVLIGLRADENKYTTNDALIQIIVPVIILTIILIYLCYKKGEKPRWQWGKDKQEK